MYQFNQPMEIIFVLKMFHLALRYHNVQLAFFSLVELTAAQFVSGLIAQHYNQMDYINVPINEDSSYDYIHNALILKFDSFILFL